MWKFYLQILTLFCQNLSASRGFASWSPPGDSSLDPAGGSGPDPRYRIALHALAICPRPLSPPLFGVKLHPWLFPGLQSDISSHFTSAQGINVQRTSLGLFFHAYLTQLNCQQKVLFDLFIIFSAHIKQIFIQQRHVLKFSCSNQIIPYSILVTSLCVYYVHSTSLNPH